MTRINIDWHAGGNSRFAPDAFDGKIGTMVPVDFDGTPIEGGAWVVDVRVSGDGTLATLTLELPDGLRLGARCAVQPSWSVGP